MSLNHTLLGLLDYQPMTGYDMKKIIQGSPFMYWSANNNQIYKALLELLEAGLVTHETRHQEGAPSKKIYTITAVGKEALAQWLEGGGEAPEVKHPFFLKLAWMAGKGQTLSHALAEYEEEVRGRWLLEKEQVRRGLFSPGRCEKEKLIWAAMYERIVDFYQREHAWAQELAQKLGELEAREGGQGGPSTQDYTEKAEEVLS